MKKINPKKKPATQYDVERARREGRQVRGMRRSYLARGCGKPTLQMRKLMEELVESFEFKVDKDAPLLPTKEEYKSVLQLVERAYMEQITLFQEDLYTKGYGDGYRAAKDEIVRCKDCKWWEDKLCTNVYGIFRTMIFNPDWYCASGERKDDDTIDGEADE